MKEQLGMSLRRKFSGSRDGFRKRGVCFHGVLEVSGPPESGPSEDGAAISPLFVGIMFAQPALINMPFFIAGTLKILYDLLLYKEFVAIQPPEEE